MVARRHGGDRRAPRRRRGGGGRRPRAGGRSRRGIRRPRACSARTLTLAAGTKIYLATETADLRRGHDGLSALVRSKLALDPYVGHLFVFVGRRGDRIKILFWDRGGFVVYYKRLARGRFRLPRVKTAPTASCSMRRSSECCSAASSCARPAAPPRGSRARAVTWRDRAHRAEDHSHLDHLREGTDSRFAT